MADNKTGRGFTRDGYKPELEKGYQPRRIHEGYVPKPQGGHQPASQGGPSGPPPNQGSGGKPAK